MYRTMSNYDLLKTFFVNQMDYLFNLFLIDEAFSVLNRDSLHNIIYGIMSILGYALNIFISLNGFSVLFVSV